MNLHLHVQWDLSFIFFDFVLTLMAIIGKLVGCGAGYAVFRPNTWESTIIGFGMNGRGAVEIVVVSVVLKLSNELLASQSITELLLTHNQFSALILMAFITTLMAPLTLKWAVMRACQSDEKATFCQLCNEGRI